MDKSKPTQRPDLFSAQQAGNSDSRRILANLENSGKAHAPGALLARMRPSHLVIGLTLLAMLAAAVAGFSYVGMAPAQHNFVISKRETPLVTAPQEVERMAAAIVNEPLPAIAPATRKPATQPMAAATDKHAATQARGAKPAQARMPLQAHAPLRSLAPVAAAAPVRARAASHASGAAVPVRMPTAGAQPDSDVALLAALVAHTGGRASGVPAMQASRDVVDRKDGDSTDALLLRCQRLGGAEAGLCRARICNGQWLHEAACRAPVSD